MRIYIIVVAGLVALVAVTPAHAYCGSQIQPGGGYKWVCTPDPIPGRPGTGGSASTFGAIAYGATTGRWGYSNDYSRQVQANQRAVKECGQPDCVVRVWFRDECGALALGDNGAWGADRGDSAAQAQSAALARCTPNGDHCQIKATRCSWDKGNN